VYYGDSQLHRCFLYESRQMKHCCKLVMKFNIDHYTKWYLPGSIGKDGNITTPYTYNYCHKCDVSIQDDCGNLYSFTSTRKWYNSSIAWRARKALKNCTDCNSVAYPRKTEASSPQLESKTYMADPVVGASCKTCGG